MAIPWRSHGVSYLKKQWFPCFSMLSHAMPPFYNGLCKHYCRPCQNVSFCNGFQWFLTSAPGFREIIPRRFHGDSMAIPWRRCLGTVFRCAPSPELHLDGRPFAQPFGRQQWGSSGGLKARPELARCGAPLLQCVHFFVPAQLVLQCARIISASLHFRYFVYVPPVCFLGDPTFP